MNLHRVKIKNFRLLEDVELVLEPDATLVVGRNNSGKTSLSEIVRRFTSEKRASFEIQDFSTACYDRFCEALQAKNLGGPEDQVRPLIPFIELRLFFRYDPTEPHFGQLAEFIVDLDMDCNEALVVLRYQLGAGEIDELFEGAPNGELTDVLRAEFFRNLRERLPKLFEINAWAEDPNDSTNKRPTTQRVVRALLTTNFINAQRGLDDVTTKESDVLAKILEALFNTASLSTADAEDREIAERLDEAVREIQDQIDSGFTTLLTSLIPTLETFGYPGLGGSEMTTETSLDVQRLLTNHTKVRYLGHSGITLPETYNGLGMRNLIFILFQVISFYRDFRAKPLAPGVHLVFIEEPEAHLHPQMQEVFIRQISRVVEQLNAGRPDDENWPVQFIVSTHSSHIANEVDFGAIRYFLPTPADSQGRAWRTVIKDLREGLAATPEPDRNFLHQYLTLTRCDLFFADKAVLIEGTSERLLLPTMIRKLDEAVEGSCLSSQYLTVMEVGGAYAHIFVKLLEFLELDSLIITDLDPVTESGGTKCQVHESTATSNACIRWWFDGTNCNPQDLIKKSGDELVKNRIRIAYQCPEHEEGACGRTLEDAFIIANEAKFELAGKTKEEKETNARQLAEKEKKTEFALRYAIDDTDWETPTYMLDGLRWLGTRQVLSPGVGLPVIDESAAELPVDIENTNDE